jgi:hypothetical protein
MIIVLSAILAFISFPFLMSFACMDAGMGPGGLGCLGVGFKHMTRPLYFIDWPLSVVADTALLPINIPRYYLSDDEARKSCGQYGDPNNKHPWIKEK